MSEFKRTHDQRSCLWHRHGRIGGAAWVAVGEFDSAVKAQGLSLDQIIQCARKGCGISDPDGAEPCIDPPHSPGPATRRSWCHRDMEDGVSGDWLLTLESGAWHQSGFREKFHRPHLLVAKLNRTADLAINDVAHDAIGASAGVVHGALVAIDAQDRISRLDVVGHESQMLSVTHVTENTDGV